MIRWRWIIFSRAGRNLSLKPSPIFRNWNAYNTGPENYLKLIRQAKEAVKIPVIGSLNGISTGGWIKYAKMIEEAGADALELNLYFVTTDPNLTAAELEAAKLQLIADIHKSIKIPLAVKLSPFFTSLPHFAASAVSAGAKGLVLFNRFYQPNLDITELEVVPELELSDFLRPAAAAALDRHPV